MAKIDIKDLMGCAVENALARREEALTTEEANQIQGGRSASFTTAGGRIFLPPVTVGYVTTGLIAMGYVGNQDKFLA